MDKVPLNNSPDLSMEEITKLLFNNKFMSDIQFKVEDQVIYAHSWEIMKRSIVFRQQFRNSLGEKKFISIACVSYEAFYQFLKFIYTDECNIEEDLIYDILKLAVRYKIVKLETAVLNITKNVTKDLALFKFGILNNYELSTNFALHRILGFMTTEDMKTSSFLNTNSKVLGEILKSDIGLQNMTEVDLFTGLIHWMNIICEENDIPRTECRRLFDKLIRSIRFPTMTANEFQRCVQKHPDVLTNLDIGNIVRHSLAVPDSNCIWVTKPRLKYQFHSRKLKSTTKSRWITRFTVAEKLMLNGIRHGLPFSNTSDYRIRITSYNHSTGGTDSLKFKFKCSDRAHDIISFGDSIKLTPNCEYSIEMIFFPSNQNEESFIICCRKSDINVSVTSRRNLVTFFEISENLFEIHFKPLSLINI